MNRTLTITALTLREAVRRRIALASLILGIAFLVIFSIGFYFINVDFKQIQANQRNGDFYLAQAYNFLHIAAMYVVNFLAIATAALITADSLAGEISSGTVQTLLAKPIHRYEVVLGKWLGNAGLLAAYVLLLAGGSSLSMFIQSGYVAPNLFLGILLIYLNSLLIMTVTLACSSRMTTLAAGGTIFGLFGLAFIGGWVERIGNALNNNTAVNVGIISSLLMPAEAIWNLASNQMTSAAMRLIGASPFSFNSTPSPLMVAYTFVYLAAFLFFAVWTFSSRDL
jgi:ABC-type transport system involved in multi-copper enzyme maturation permease subunit